MDYKKKKNYINQEGIKKIISETNNKSFLTRNGVGKPTEDFDRKFDESNSEVSQRSETEATWAQATQYCPAKFYSFFFLSLF